MPKVAIIVDVPEDLSKARTDLSVASLGMLMMCSEMVSHGRNPRIFEEATTLFGLILDEVKAERFVTTPLVIETGNPKEFYANLIAQKTWLEAVITATHIGAKGIGVPPEAEGLLNLLDHIQDAIEPEEDPDGAEE